MIAGRMFRRSAARCRRLKLWLTVITAVLALAAVASSLLAYTYQRRIMEASRYNTTFDFGQTAAELMRLQLALEESRGEGSIEEVRFRYAILVNRLSIVTINRVDPKSAQGKVLGSLQREVLALAPLIAQLPDPTMLTLTIDQLRPFVGPVLRLAGQAHSQASNEIQSNQNWLIVIFAAICCVTLSLVLFGAGLMVVVLRQNAHLDRIVRTDWLTGIANRFAFSHALRQGEGEDQTMILLDVDHFKTLNDTFGHAAGDKLLIELSQRLRWACGDAAMIARIGGDEFAVLYRGSDAEARSIACCERILEQVRSPFDIEDRQVRSHVTLGLSSGGAGLHQGTCLFKHADIALYEAKAAGRNRFVVFRPEMNQHLGRRQALQNGMREAIARGEFFLLFQPIVDLSTGLTCGFEALLRWQHHELGLISPVEFIPVAEESGQIAMVGLWVIEEACRQAARFPTETFVAVNVSADQLVDPLLVQHTTASLARHGLEPERLEIEITESTLIENDERALAVLHALRAMGCRISLDDFGTGYASLSYLRRFPFDKIKIDQSFLRSRSHREEGIAIIAGTCDLARRLNLTIVAEGVETEEHRQIVASAGSHQGQGYLFDRPLSPEASLARIEAEARRTSARPKPEREQGPAEALMAMI